MSGPAFISYATADRKQALSVCKALEKRGTPCWISCRDVAPGENYQEAIVRAIRRASAVVLVFSRAANTSDEIKKELSLASRYRVCVFALRTEDVEPSDAFAYELSTRQWIDAFGGWDRSLDLLARQLAQTGPAEVVARTATARKSSNARRPTWIAAAALLLLVIAAGMWFRLRPGVTAAHSMTVRLAGFQLLSQDLPPTMPQMVREEIIGAFGDDGVIRVSTAGALENGKAPAYVLGGALRRDGDVVRVITRLTNERSGVALWTDTFDYDGKDVGRIPRRIAVDAGNMVHCGLFAASTYPHALPDTVMSDYMKFCQNSWWSQQFSNPGKALDAARKVAASAPDFSWGWSAITVASQLEFYRTDPGPHREELRRIGLDAAEKALRIDPRNSEALAQKSMLIGRLKWAEQESLLRRSIAARPLFCGCEHYLYGIMLTNVGRSSDAVGQMRRSTELLALDGISQFGLAEALLVTGDADEAASHFDAAVDLFRDPGTAPFYALRNALETGDFAAGIKALSDPRVKLPEAKRTAILAGFQALAGRGSKGTALQALTGLSQRSQDSIVVRLVSLLGAHAEALQIIEGKALNEHFSAASWLWYPSMRAALRAPEAEGVVGRIGLISYWKTSRTKPDLCAAKDAPPFCRLI